MPGVRPINVDVLIVDDFMTISIDQRGQEGLNKIICDRDGRLPTLISSQSDAAYWVETLPDRVVPDSLVSRLGNGHRLRIGDFAMRKATAPNRTGRIEQTAGPISSAQPGTYYPEHDSTESPKHRYQKLAADIPGHGGRLLFFPAQLGWISSVHQTEVRFPLLPRSLTSEAYFSLGKVRRFKKVLKTPVFRVKPSNGFVDFECD